MTDEHADKKPEDPKDPTDWPGRCSKCGRKLVYHPGTYGPEAWSMSEISCPKCGVETAW